jgi:hypothetical protein
MEKLKAEERKKKMLLDFYGNGLVRMLISHFLALRAGGRLRSRL